MAIREGVTSSPAVGRTIARAPGIAEIAKQHGAKPEFSQVRIAVLMLSLIHI
jgi:hypothetical protein